MLRLFVCRHLLFFNVFFFFVRMQKIPVYLSERIVSIGPSPRFARRSLLHFDDLLHLISMPIESDKFIDQFLWMS